MRTTSFRVSNVTAPQAEPIQGELIATLCPEGSIRSLSPAFSALTHEPTSDWLSRFLPEMVHPGERSAFAQAFVSLKEGQAVHLRNLCLRLAGGRLMLVHLTLLPDTFGGDLGAIYVFGLSVAKERLALRKLGR